MTWISGGIFRMGADVHYAEEVPAHKVWVSGSHLGTPNYWRRYRPAARFPQPIDTSTCHVGFRCIVRV